MKKYLLVCLLVLCACAPAAEYETISAKQAHEMMKDDVVIIDVRSEEEYKETHIPRSINVPLDQLEDKITSMVSDKKSILLIYCRSGNRSRQASSKLAELGYKQVYDFGGINDWPYETE